MATFKLVIKCDNAAFADDLCGALGAIVGTCADKIESGEMEGKLRDANGNTVATYGFEAEVTKCQGGYTVETSSGYYGPFKTKAEAENKAADLRSGWYV